LRAQHELIISGVCCAQARCLRRERNVIVEGKKKSQVVTFMHECVRPIISSTYISLRPSRPAPYLVHTTSCLSFPFLSPSTPKDDVTQPADPTSGCDLSYSHDRHILLCLSGSDVHASQVPAHVLSPIRLLLVPKCGHCEGICQWLSMYRSSDMITRSGLSSARSMPYKQDIAPW